MTEIGKKLSSVLCQDGFGMKLNAVNRQRCMLECHDHVVFTAGCDLKLRRQIVLCNHQRMVPGYLKAGRQSLKQTGSVMGKERQFAMHRPLAFFHTSPEGLPNHLVTQTNPQDGN